MKTAALLALLAALCFTAAASADYRGDPRKCSFNKPAQCARDSARMVLRLALGTREGVHIYAGPTDCKAAGSLLKWRCVYGGTSTPYKANVAFWDSSSGWKHRVTFAQ